MSPYSDPQLPWLLPKASVADTFGSGLQSWWGGASARPGDGRANPTILLCCGALATASTIAIPAFKAFQRARMGGPSSNIVLARGSASDHRAADAEQRDNSRHPQLVTLLWVWSLQLGFDVWADLGLLWKTCSTWSMQVCILALMGPLLCLKFSVSVTTWRNEAISFDFTRTSVRASVTQQAGGRSGCWQPFQWLTAASLTSRFPPSIEAVCRRSIIEIHTLTLGKQHPERVTGLFSWGHGHSKSGDLIARVLTN